MHRRRPLLLFSLLIAAFLAACTEEAQLPAASQTNSAAPSLKPTATLPDLPDARLVFIRGDDDPGYPTAGAIWLSDLSGANARQVTPDGVTASYMGLGASESGGTLLYYATQDAEANTSVYRNDLDASETTLLLSYRDIPDYYFADVSPDGRYLVHTQSLGLDMYDFSTGTSITLLQSGSGPDCLANVLEQCYRAIAPRWSPDGRLLTVVHSVYEGGWAEVVDPFQTPVAVLTTGDRKHPSRTVWSPGSDAVCAHGVGLGDPSGLYLLESPDWKARNLFPEFEDYTVNPDGRQVVACDWVNPNEVAFLTTVGQPQRRGELHVFDRVSGKSTLITTLQDGTGCCGGIISAVPGTSYVVAQVLRMEGGSTFLWSQPAVVDLQTGEIQHVLQKRDFLVTAFRP